MAKNEYRRILLSKSGVLYQFITYFLEDSDGSFYITLQREGDVQNSYKWDSVNTSVRRTEHEEVRPKKKKISYHSSGCVRYHNTSHNTIYFEPITSITQINNFCIYSIPCVEKLDKFCAVLSDDDTVFEADDINGRSDFNFIICPWNCLLNEKHIAIRYKDIFSFVILTHQHIIKIPNDLTEHFVTLTPSKGLFDRQTITNDEALIDFHQNVHKSKEIILFSPNGEGIYKIICATPMRIGPALEIEFYDKDYNTEIIVSKPSCLLFKIRDKHGNVIKKEISIKSIELHAEL